jgi:hypothetical protein
MSIDNASLRKIIQSWIDDLNTVQPRDVIRIVSGEAFYKLVSDLEKPLLDAKRKGATIKIIAGPIISVDEKNKSNIILELAEKKALELWISPFRQLSHYRIIGQRLVFKENYHYPLSEDRHGEYIYDQFAVAKYIYEFENLIKYLSMRKYANRKMIITKTDVEIIKLRQEYGKNYDFLISKLLKSQGETDIIEEK